MSGYTQDGRGGWYPSSRLSRYTDDPAVHAWALALAATLYYRGDEDDPTPYNDAQYEALVKIVLEGWSKLTPWLQELLGSPRDLRSTSYHVQLSDEDLVTARRIYELSEPLPVETRLARAEEAYTLARIN
ncbi:MAG: hypothetical protein AAF608_05145 [Pseudomonadota bacterium]